MDEPENSNSVTAVQSPDEAVPVTSMWTPGDTSVPWNCYHSPDRGAKKGLSFEGIRRAVESRTGIFTSFDQTALRDIFNVKKLVLSLRRHLAPERDVFAVLTNRPNSLLSAETQVYFRDIHDHILRINDALETYRELLSNVLDGYLTQVSNRLGSITKTLSVVATVSIPFVVISGMWGMNFERIPLQGWSHGFWFMLVLQLALGGLLLAVLRWRKLL
jgi:magnesium transporter